LCSPEYDKLDLLTRYNREKKIIPFPRTITTFAVVIVVVLLVCDQQTSLRSTGIIKRRY